MPTEVKVLGVEYPSAVATVPETDEKIGGLVEGVSIDNQVAHFRIGCIHRGDFQNCPAFKAGSYKCHAENRIKGEELVIKVGCWPAIKTKLNGQH